jgi:hypothetical protein
MRTNPISSQSRNRDNKFAKWVSRPTKCVHISRELFNPKHFHSRQVLQPSNGRQGERPLSNTGRQPVAAGRPRNSHPVDTKDRGTGRCKKGTYMGPTKDQEHYVAQFANALISVAAVSENAAPSAALKSGTWDPAVEGYPGAGTKVFISSPTLSGHRSIMSERATSRDE